jgi:hypothetical protein
MELSGDVGVDFSVLDSAASSLTAESTATGSEEPAVDELQPLFAIIMPLNADSKITAEIIYAFLVIF